MPDITPIASRPEVSVVRITDFKPGIADNPGLNYPPGQAQRTNTFRCLARQSGALVPAPRQDFSLNGTLFEAANPSLSVGYFCSGIYAAGPEVPASGAASNRPHELWIAVEYGKAGPSKERRLQRIRLFEAAPTTDLIVTETNAAVDDTGLAWGAVFGQSRSNHGAPTTPGIPVVLISWGSAVPAMANVWEYPDDTAPTLNVPFVIDNQIAIVTPHQGRAVLRVQTGYSHGVNGSWSTTEDIRFTDANDMHVLSVVQAFFPENTDGYSLIASMSANELFMLKLSGALMVSGDIANPIVRNLPMVPGNGSGYASQGIRTPIGFIYPGRNNLWVWTGGDSANAIFENMHPLFWVPAQADSFLANSALWYAAENLVFLSNNFFYDTVTRALWQLDDPSTVSFAWMTGFQQYIYGAPGQYTQSTPQVIWGYNLLLKALSYSWQSQPLWETVDRLIRVREVQIRAQGQGTIIVTATAQDGTTGSHTFTIGSSIPVMQYNDLAVTGDSIVLKVVATGKSRVVNDGITTNASPQVMSATAAFTSLDAGAAVSGVGVPAGAAIKTVVNATTVILTANCTASASNVQLTIQDEAPTLWELNMGYMPVQRGGKT